MLRPKRQQKQSLRQPEEGGERQHLFCAKPCGNKQFSPAAEGEEQAWGEHEGGRRERTGQQLWPLGAKTLLPTKTLLPCGKEPAPAAGPFRLRQIIREWGLGEKEKWGTETRRPGSSLRGRGDLTTEKLPGCGLCREVTSDRTWAGGQGVLATLGKWSEGSESSPTSPLKTMCS